MTNDTKPPAPGLYPASVLSNEEYHRCDGISKSGLDAIAIDPSVYQWMKNAPVDETKTGALDMGTALHTLLLEPHLFDEQFIVAPNVDRRTKDGKARYAEFIEEAGGKMVLTHEENRKLRIMRESAFSHPAAKWILESPGQNESSIFWIDSETGELCRIRPDKIVETSPIIADVKKMSDMSRMWRSFMSYRYHVQSAMYTDGYSIHFGEVPTFVFIVISDSIECGRYPVRVLTLDGSVFDEGHQLYRQNLSTYHHCKRTGEWGGVEVLDRPAWAA